MNPTIYAAVMEELNHGFADSPDIFVTYREAVKQEIENYSKAFVPFITGQALLTSEQYHLCRESFLAITHLDHFYGQTVTAAQGKPALAWLLTERIAGQFKAATDNYRIIDKIYKKAMQ